MKLREIAIIICALLFGLLLPSAIETARSTALRKIPTRDRYSYRSRLPSADNDVFHYTSQLVEFSNLTETEKSEIIQLKDEPFLARKQLSLLRCSFYRFTFKIYASKNRTEIESKTKIIQTPTEESKSNILLTSPFGKTIELLWNTQYPECMSNYTLTVVDLSSNKRREITIQNGTNGYEIDGLIPCTDYSIRLDTYSKNGHRDSTSVQDKTSLAKITPEEFHFSILEGGNSIEFNWTRLRDIERCDGDYFIKLYPLDDDFPLVADHHTPYNLAEVTISGFKSCQRYNATLNANYFYKVATLEEIILPFAKPSNIHGLKVNRENGYLEWNKPLENENCVANYSIIVNGLEEEIITESHYNLEKLERCKNYTISVTMRNQMGEEYEPLEIQFEMDFDVLHFELHPTYSMFAENQTLLVFWEDIEYRNHCDIKYDFNWSGNPLQESSHNFYSIENLEFCKEDLVQIRISYGDQSNLYQQEIYFGETFAAGIGNVSYAYDESTEAIVFNWEKPGGFENCNFTYVVETDQFRAQVEEESYSIAWDSQDIPFRVSLTDSYPYGRDNGREIVVRSALPPVTKIKHQNNDKDGSTKISWTKPNTSKKIKHYVVIWDTEVRITKETSITNIFTKCVDWEVVIFVQYESNNEVSDNSTYQFKYIVAPDPIINLSHTFKNPDYILNWDIGNKNVDCYKFFTLKTGEQSFTIPESEFKFQTWSDDENYKFEVVALYDDSHKSKGVTHSFATPGPVKSLEISESNEKVLIEWTAPGNLEHVPVSYAITLNDVNKNTTKTSITIDSVEYCVDLSIKIIVLYNTELTRSATFTKRLAKTPGEVSNIRIVPDSKSSNLNLSWSPPEKNPNCVNTYKVQINSETFFSTTTRYTITKWEPCSTIIVTIAGQNVVAEFGPERTKTYDTPNVTVSEVKNLELVPTERTLKINWDEPERGKLCVTGYRVVIWDTATNNPIYDHENAIMFLVLEDMKACRGITVQVTPLSKTGDGILLSKDTKILPRAATALTPVQSIDTQSRSLKLKTLFDDEFYLCPLEEIKVTCVQNSTDVSTVQIVELGGVVPEKNLPFEVVVGDLEPYEAYNCFASVKMMMNESELCLWSPASFSTTINTLEDFSEKPAELNIANQGHNTIKITWTTPLKPNGKITHYEVKILEMHPLYYVPAHCLHEPLAFNTSVVEKEWRVEDMRPHTAYKIKVRAINGAGLGEEAQIGAQTDPYIPDGPLDFEVVSVRGPITTEEYSATSTIKWKFPCALNGKFEQFRGLLRGRHPDFVDTKAEFSMAEVRDDYEIVFDTLQASFNYEINLHAVTSKFNSDDVVGTFRAPAAIPNFLAVNLISLNTTVNPSASATMSVRRRELLSTGTILYYAVLISEMDCQPAPEAQRSIMDIEKEWPSVRSWYEVQSDECQRQYQSTPVRYSHGLRTSGSTTEEDHLEEQEMGEFLEIQIGTERCDETSLNTYCNGPLKPGTKYAVVLRLFTETGFTDNNYIIIETISTINMVLIILLMFGILSSAFLVGLMLIVRKKNKRAVKELHRLESPKKSNGAGDILTKNFPEHFDDLSKNNCERLNNEFSIINSGGPSQSNSYAIAKANANKNRYTNVLPYDFNRVILEKSDDADTDYINASFINGYRKPRDYIASQGPKMESSYDFWKMILQYKVSSIIMLTSYKEGDKDKCHEYFPANDSETILFNDVKIKCQKEIEFQTHKKRIFTIEKNNYCQTVFHYHFLKWPDHSCPQDPNDLIAFTRTVASERRHPTHPMVVHCSAGVGRTGTFIALDIALQQMKAEKKINILDIVKELRRQRMKMVQSFSQYLLIYQCIVIILKEYEAAHSGPIWKRLSKKNAPEKKTVNFTHNFGMLHINAPKELNLSQGNSDIPPAELIGNPSKISPDLLDNPGNSINLRAIPPDTFEYPNGCFEPEDSIT